jgi:type II secretory pathway pseudopilin PulG
MIELLVVIAVIGVLAVAVLSSINPIEQINKGRDTRARSDAAQMISAVDRFFATQEHYPWNEDNATTSPPFTAPSTDYVDEFIYDETLTLTSSTDSWNWLDVMADRAEVKEGFVQRIKADADLNYMVVKPDGANATMYVCFTPSSFEFQSNAYDLCVDGGVNADISGTACPAVGCMDGTAIETCFACIP